MKAQDVMVRDVLSVRPDSEEAGVPNRDAAGADIKRVPIVANGKVVGIVSRGWGIERAAQ